MEEKETADVCVVGGGLVGSLIACLLARRGFSVDLYEMRGDPRQDSTLRGRSINLALSHRGCEALKRAGLLDKVTSAAIPMRARMIHSLDGALKAIPYGRPDQFIRSVDRRELNCILLTASESHPRVRLNFYHKLLSCNAKKGQVSFRLQSGDEETKDKEYSVILGCDGAFSAVRQGVSRRSKFNYSQTFIDHSYVEVPFPAKVPGQHAMAKEFLHIWPRHEFMLIALPNEDGSFTGTMFMPSKLFDGLSGRQELLDFYKTTFPDALEVIGEDNLVEGYFSTQPQPLVSIKCSPYDFCGRVLLLGDAAHAVVPFYGQGMNAGFEDCLILDDLIQQISSRISKDLIFHEILPTFTAQRVKDTHAVADLSMFNYIEMRSSVNSVWFLLRKKLDNFLFRIFPNTWVPLYTMVSFTRTPYSQAVAGREWQDRILDRVMRSAGFLAICSIGFAVYRKTNHLQDLYGFLSTNFIK